MTDRQHRDLPPLWTFGLIISTPHLVLVLLADQGLSTPSGPDGIEGTYRDLKGRADPSASFICTMHTEALAS
ncbi:MAG: hypothetical protein GY939_26030 [Actinomycetia bacterium]|nr:hypothetical protein [Actinomycetes bacterium]